MPPRGIRKWASTFWGAQKAQKGSCREDSSRIWGAAVAPPFPRTKWQGRGDSNDPLTSPLEDSIKGAAPFFGGGVTENLARKLEREDSSSIYWGDAVAPHFLGPFGRGGGQQ